MKVLIDTNVVMDVLFARDPFLVDSITVLHMCEDGFAEAFVSTKTIADVYYFLRKYLHSEEKARHMIRKLLGIVGVCDVTGQHLQNALSMDNDDLEDAIQAASAMANGCSMIISRNPNHFDGTGMKCLRPEEFVV